MKHGNIPVFIPHLGCKHLCSFCNQVKISGKSVPSFTEGENIIKEGVARLKESKKKAQIAFFGGSFTALDYDVMCRYLQMAQKYIKLGLVEGIRISTRPDCIDEKMLNLLTGYGVTSIELGCQSMIQEVLDANLRGHSVEDVIDSARLIQEHGIELGVQMMIGLYQSTKERDIQTGKILGEIKADTVRIYPTMVLPNTYLAQLYQEKQYFPPSLEELIETTAEILPFFWKSGTKVIKLGLHPDESLRENIVAGSYHSAFREKVEGRIYRNKMIDLLSLRELEKGKGVESCIFYVHPLELSKAIGQKRENIEYTQQLGKKVKISPSLDLQKGEIDLEILLWTNEKPRIR